MRSFLLKDLVGAEEHYFDSDEDKVPKTQTASQMRTIAEIQKSNERVNETAIKNNWPYTFKIEFKERSFSLTARTKFELTEWMRIFTLVLDMNKIGCTTS